MPDSLPAIRPPCELSHLLCALQLALVVPQARPGGSVLQGRMRARLQCRTGPTPAVGPRLLPAGETPSWRWCRLSILHPRFDRAAHRSQPAHDCDEPSLLLPHSRACRRRRSSISVSTPRSSIRAQWQRNQEDRLADHKPVPCPARWKTTDLANRRTSPVPTQPLLLADVPLAP